MYSVGMYICWEWPLKGESWPLNLHSTMGWLRLVGSDFFKVSCAKEPYIRDDILQKRPTF